MDPKFQHLLQIKRGREGEREGGREREREREGITIITIKHTFVVLFSSILLVA